MSSTTPDKLRYAAMSKYGRFFTDPEQAEYFMMLPLSNKQRLVVLGQLLQAEKAKDDEDFIPSLPTTPEYEGDTEPKESDYE